MLRPITVLLGFFTLLTGVAYPAIITWVAPAPDPELLGRAPGAPGEFWGRPSAVSYDAATSSGTNLGPTNPALRDAVKQRIDALRAADPSNAQMVPVDLVTASASGLDPHISPAAAYYQVERVARIRGLPVERVRALVGEHIEPRTLGLLGEPRVNVLRLNLALDRIGPSRT